MIEQYSTFWVDLNPTQGSEINKIRPCVIISPVEMNEHLRTVIIAPITNTGKAGYPTRVALTVNKINGWVILDQIRAIDKTRLREEIGLLDSDSIRNIKSIIKEMLVD